MTPQPGDRIVVWFSNGAASAVAWRETLRRYGDICEVVAVNNPIEEEDAGQKDFLDADQAKLVYNEAKQKYGVA